MPRNNFFYVLTTAALRTPLTRPRHGPFMEESINLFFSLVSLDEWAYRVNFRIGRLPFKAEQTGSLAK